MSEPRPGGGPTLENRLPAEDINTSSEHPLREAGWLIGATVAVLLAVVFVVGWAGRWLAPHVPFAAEVALAQRLIDTPEPADAAHREASRSLQDVADRIAAQMALPSGMAVVVRYDDAPVVNAYATLGGRIIAYRGLLQRLGSEDAVAALLAHEIAHVRHRHVAANAGRGLALALLLGTISGDAGAAASRALLGPLTNIAGLNFSREQEAEADAAALRAVVAVYGHGGGVVDLFERLGSAAEGAQAPGLELLSTHPFTATRLEAARALAAAHGWPMTGQPVALPRALSWPQPQP